MDPTVVAVPGYFATMGAEYAYLRRRAEREGPSPADYERRDTVTSLAMGVGSLLAPLLAPKVMGPITPGKGRFGKALVATAVGAIAVTTIADAVVRSRSATSAPSDASRARTAPRLAAPDLDLDLDEADRSAASSAASCTDAPLADGALDGPPLRLAEQVAAVGGMVAVVAGGVAITSTLASRTTSTRLWRHRLLPDLGAGPLALAAAVVGWDFIYYWNHRFMHESRYMWAIHSVHHSSERYNLSTALRQPVADVLGTFVPYGALALLGVRPDLILQARGINLLYQYWIHTDTIASLGPLEEVVNSPSHHRVHHGSNRQYLDRNHGSILILWDRLFGTFEREDETVVYGLTTNVDTFNPLRVAGREHADMLRDVRRSRTWRQRLSYVLRGPGWSYANRPDAPAAVPTG